MRVDPTPYSSPDPSERFFKKPSLNLTPLTFCGSEGEAPSTASSVATATSFSVTPQRHMNTTTSNTSRTDCSSTASCSSASLNNLAKSRRSGSSIRLSLPSPSRPRLDPQYAARLAPRMYHRSVSAPLASTSSPNGSADQLGLVPPPGITRDSNESIFRPTPILTGTSQTTSTTVATAVAVPSHSQDEDISNMNTTPASSTKSVSTVGNYFFNSSYTGMRHGSHSSVGYAASPSFSTYRTYTRRSSTGSLADVGTSDRFIPSRVTSNFHVNLWDSMSPASASSRPSPSSRSGNNATGGNNQSYNSNINQINANTNIPDDPSNGTNRANEASDPSAMDAANDSNGRSNDGNGSSSTSLLNTLLRSELLGENLNPFASQQHQYRHQYHHGPGGARNNARMEPLREGGNYLHFQSPRQQYQSSVLDETMGSGPYSVVNNFSLTPVRSAASQRLMAAPQKRKRRISKVPFKVLDAPALQDDFYLNLVDWSSQNVLAVGLGSCVYLWSACTSKVTKLCDLAQSEDIVTSVNWAQRGTHLAVGTNRGEVLLWDAIKCKKVRTMAGHSARVGTLAWTGPVLASGSRDRLIYLRDVRVQASFTDRLAAHKQEVCGLKWSYDEPSFLASGGNDNQLHVVDSRNPSQPVQRFSDHTAAVKAIAWSPHQHGLLASGGGTADRCIRFWNTLSGTSLNCVDTGSQVCNLAWSQNCNEIVSTHGYSLNQIVVWRYPSMSKVTTLTGHTYRVLYLAMSPDGSTIVTGAGDETLRFWQVFPGPKSDSKNSSGGLLFPNTLGSVIR